MGLLERIFFRHWPRPLDAVGPPDLTLDLASGALGNLHLNGPTEVLRERLGPPVSWNRWRKFGQWHYPQLGIHFDTFENRIEGIMLVPREGERWGAIYPGWAKRWRPWTGSIRFPDGFRIGALEARPEDFVAHAGPPDEREEDEEEILLTYSSSSRIRGVFVEASFTPQGALGTLILENNRD